MSTNCEENKIKTNARKPPEPKLDWASFLEAKEAVGSERDEDGVKQARAEKREFFFFYGS